MWQWKWQFVRFDRLLHVTVGLFTVGFFWASVGLMGVVYSKPLSHQKALTLLDVPEAPPAVTQASIDRALVMFNIRVPSHVKHPVLDLNMYDRGLTTVRGKGKLEVRIGPAAFASWGLLASTLAHEIEVHCYQNFRMIRIMDMVGLHGTHNAEREAYLYELEHADRFLLGDLDRQNIQETLDFYYPEQTGNVSLSADLTSQFGSWLARNTLR